MITTLEVVALTRELLYLSLLLSLPLMLFGLLVGLVISIFQAVTQINEQSLTFVPRMVVVALSLILLAPWMIALIVQYTRDVFEKMVTLVLS